MKMHEKLENSARIRRLQNLGVPVPHDEIQSAQVLIQQDSAMENRVFDLARSGGIGLQLSFVITILMGTLTISDADVTLPVNTQPFIWLPDPVEIGDEHGYRFCGRGAGYSRDSVLNHYIGSERAFRSGQMLARMLLGYNFDAIPDAFRHGAVVPATVTIVDQFHHRHEAELKLWIDRSERLRPPHKFARAPLFSRDEDAGLKRSSAAS